MSQTDTPEQQDAPVEAKSLGEKEEVTFTTDDLSARCVIGKHPKYGFYFQGIQCKKGSIYPHTGSAWSEKGDRGSGVCHNPENPLILPIWEWMADVGFAEDQMQAVRDYLEACGLIDVKVGEARVEEANLT